MKSWNILTDLVIIDDVVQNNNLHRSSNEFHVVIHPMQPFGWKYWDHAKNYNSTDDYLENGSPQACSWLRDQEYLVDFKYYEKLEFKDGQSMSHLHMYPKIRFIHIE